MTPLRILKVPMRIGWTWCSLVVLMKTTNNPKGLLCVFLTSPLHLNTFAKRKKKPLPNFPTPPFTLNFFTYNQMLNSLLALMPNPKKSPTMLLTYLKLEIYLVWKGWKTKTLNLPPPKPPPIILSIQPTFST